MTEYVDVFNKTSLLLPNEIFLHTDMTERENGLMGVTYMINHTEVITVTLFSS